MDINHLGGFVQSAVVRPTSCYPLFDLEAHNHDELKPVLDHTPYLILLNMNNAISASSFMAEIIERVLRGIYSQTMMTRIE